MRTYQFKPTRDKSQVNWDIMSQLNRMETIYPNLSGFTKGFCFGYSSIDGPRVHLYLWLYGAPEWDDNAYIDLPIQPLQLVLPSGKADFAQSIGPLVDFTTGLPIADGEYYKIVTNPTPTTNRRARLLMPNGGSITDSATLNGTYLRN